MKQGRQGLSGQADLEGCIRAARQLQIARSPRDADLSRQRLVPCRAALLESARRMRRKADAHFVKVPAPTPADHEFPADASGRPPPYPLGCCRPIRDWVWAGLANDPSVCSLRRQGLTWKKIYYIEEGGWFQNAIQCGDWVLDVAHDTVHAADTPILLTPLDELVWENLDDWRRYAEVAAGYYRLSLYPNLYVPLLFPMIPFLAVRETGRLEFLYSQQMLFFLDLGDGWRRCRALLDDPEWIDRRLPPALEKRLLALAAVGPEPFPVEIRACSPAELRQLLGDWDQVWRLDPVHQNVTLRNYERLAGLAARRLREARLVTG